jgi:hypothetical protein
MKVGDIVTPARPHREERGMLGVVMLVGPEDPHPVYGRTIHVEWGLTRRYAEYESSLRIVTGLDQVGDSAWGGC